MEITDRKRLEELNKDYHKWAKRYMKERIRYGKACYEFGILIAAKKMTEERVSFENKIIKFMEEEDNQWVKDLWKDYTEGYNKYKSAEMVAKAVESEINSIKFRNREVL